MQVNGVVIEDALVVTWQLPIPLALAASISVWFRTLRPMVLASILVSSRIRRIVWSSSANVHNQPLTAVRVLKRRKNRLWTNCKWWRLFRNKQSRNSRARRRRPRSQPVESFRPSGHRWSRHPKGGCRWGRFKSILVFRNTQIESMTAATQSYNSGHLGF